MSKTDTSDNLCVSYCAVPGCDYRLDGHPSRTAEIRARVRAHESAHRKRVRRANGEIFCGRASSPRPRP